MALTIAEKMRRVLAEATRYQTHTWKGEVLNAGIRGVERRAHIRLDDVRGHRVLDLGCATGAESLWAAEQGAAAVCGVEVDSAIADAARRMVKASRLRQVEIVCRDLRDGPPPGEWDTVFAFAITHHVGWRPLWEQVPGCRVAYLESGAPCPWDAATLSRRGWRAELLACTPANAADPRPVRGLFRLERE